MIAGYRTSIGQKLDHERTLLQHALYYGLDALLDGHVVPRYEPAGSA